MTPKPAFKMVPKGRISDHVLQQIKKSIIDGIYKPGEKLPAERDLLEMFNVSRGSLREALKALERLGFIVVKTGVFGGAYVTERAVRSFSGALYDVMKMNKVSFREILELRAVVEPGIASLAALRRTEDDVKRLEELTAAREKAIKAEKVPIVVNIDWHQALAMASGNQVLCLILDAAAMVLHEQFKKVSLGMADHKSIVKFHKEITECVKRKDAEKASAVMREHIADVSERLLKDFMEPG